MANTAVQKIAYKLIAHRGFPFCYPENSLIGIEAAIKAGAKFIEIDIQLSRDHVPIVFHDVLLKRITGVRGVIFAKKYSQLKTLSIAEKKRFGDSFKGEKIPSLAQLVSLLLHSPQVLLFVEIKRASLLRFGTLSVVQQILRVLQPIKSRCVIISYASNALLLSRQQDTFKIGYILKAYNNGAKQWVEHNQPDFIFCNRKKIAQTTQPLWSGSWQWVLYQYGLQEIKAWIPQGVIFIETDNIQGLLDAD